MELIRLPSTLASCLLLVNILSSAAQAVTIDFEQLATQAQGGSSLFTVNSPYSESGFALTHLQGSQFVAWQDQAGNYTGSVALATGLNETASLTQDNGQAFTVISIDLAPFSVGSTSPDFTALITGTTIGGAILTENCNVDTSLSLTTCQLSSNFTVLSLRINQGDSLGNWYQFDNIVISSVPVPAAVWLFGSGLLGLIGLGHSRRIH